MSNKDFTVSSKILMTMLAAGDMFIVTPWELRKRLWNGKPLGDNKSFYSVANYLAKRGWIKYVDKNNERFIKLTKNGQLEALLAKARLPGKRGKWDGKWRVVLFDIPEDSEEKRNFFRYLLKQNGFLKLQLSVYVSPYPLNREVIVYLDKTGLSHFIRILKVEEMDNDRDLKKMFNLA